MFRIAAGAGFAGDRYEPAELLAREGQLDSIGFECLAERTIALAQQRLRAGDAGYDSRILRRLRGVLPYMVPSGGTVVSNAGAADPKGAALATRDLLRDLGLEGTKVASVSGDDVLGALDFSSARILGTDDSLADIADRVVSANAYLGVEGIRTALDEGAGVVLTGRVSDAALFLGPIAHHYGWNMQDGDRVAAGTLVGHLLECAGQLTGGYFADGRNKVVPGLATLGFPFADVAEDGTATYSKVVGSGGLITRETVLEQLFYEIDDPHCYYTPDAAVDLTGVTINDLGQDRVRVSGATTIFSPDTLKVSVGVRDGFAATSSIVYAGFTALERAKLAAEIIATRWVEVHGRPASELTMDYLGVNAARPWFEPETSPPEVQLRVSLRTLDQSLTGILAHEMESLYTNGPAGGGGVTTKVIESVGIVSTLIDRNSVTPIVEVIS